MITDSKNVQVKILFVDDDISILNSLKRLTRNIEAEFFFCDSSIEALQLIEKDSIDIIVSDLRMPQMDGITLLSEVASKYPETIRIMLTGNSDSELVLASINKGRIWSFISKPWDGEQLILTLKQAIQTRHLMRTRVNQLYSELEQAKLLADSGSTAKSNFLAVMSHEIRTPMNAMLGSMDLLCETNLDIEQKELVFNAITAGKSLLSLVSNILDFSKIEAGKLELNINDFNVLDLVDYLQSLFNERVKAKGIALMFCLTPTLSAQLRLDEQRVKQILINLIGNAIKFTQAGGVELSIYPCDNTVVFEVKDTGIGIGHEHIEQLFKKFVQVDSSYQRQFEGTGLGLAITKQLVDLMGGQVSVTSKEGEGSVFRVTIPHELFTKPLIPKEQLINRNVDLINCPSFCESSFKKQFNLWNCEVNFIRDKNLPKQILFHTKKLKTLKGQHNLKGQYSLAALKQEVDVWSKSYHHLLKYVFDDTRKNSDLKKTKQHKAVGKGQTILVVEDSLPNQLVIKTMLKRAGYHVEIASNGLEAIDFVEQNLCELVLMDLSMPVMDGAQACRIIRSKFGEMTELPIWAMTANVTKDDIRHCTDAGMNEFIEKPINRTLLLNKIDELLSRGLSEVTSDEQSRSFQENTENVICSSIVEQLILDTGEEVFNTIIQLFVAETQKRVKQIIESNEQLDFQTIENEAHAIKSSATTIGAVPLGVLAKELELKCKLQKHCEIPSIINDLAQLTEQSIEKLTDFHINYELNHE